MYYDHSVAARRQECIKSFENMKKEIKITTHKNHDALEHIEDMEFKLREQEQKLKEYRNFFTTLKQLI